MNIMSTPNAAQSGSFKIGGEIEVNRLGFGAIRITGSGIGANPTIRLNAFNPRTVAKAVVKLADHPRNSTGVGAPMALLKAAQLLGPNVSAVAANGFMSGYFGQADPAQNTDGNLYLPPDDDGEVDGGFRKPNQRRRTEVLVASLPSA
jgi:hypothetical protein